MAMWTVVGAYGTEGLLVFGAIRGEHEVGGDMSYYGFQPYAGWIEADTAQEAMEEAAAAYERQHGI